MASLGPSPRPNTVRIGSLKLLQWNARGIRNRAEFFQHIYTNSYDIVCIQESLLHPSRDFKIKGYEVIRCDREVFKKASGGVLTLIRKGLVYTNITYNSKLEYLAVKIKLAGKHLQVVNIYILPRTKNFVQN